MAGKDCVWKAFNPFLEDKKKITKIFVDRNPWWSRLNINQADTYNAAPLGTSGLANQFMNVKLRSNQWTLLLKDRDFLVNPNTLNVKCDTHTR